MKCDQCHGFGLLRAAPDQAPWLRDDAEAPPVPCPRCGGTGISHCCEGDRCHPGDAE